MQITSLKDICKKVLTGTYQPIISIGIPSYKVLSQNSYYQLF